jgi:DNA-binding transcriptional LysR family regulator
MVLGMISDSLRYFVVAAKHEHLTKAAEELDLSQPALSRNIARLEEHFGVQLFDRVGRGIRLNSYGYILLQHVQRASAELEDGADKIRELASNIARTISLGFLSTFGITLIPRLIRGFNETSRNTSPFRLLQGPLPLLRSKLDSREVDLCFSAPRFRDPVYEWRPLYEEELFVVVSSNHPFAGRGEIDFIEISQEPFITLKSQYGLRQITDELCSEAHFSPRITFEAEEVATARGLAGAGSGVTLAPISVFGLSDLTVDLKVRTPKCRRTVGLSWRRDRHFSPQIREFREYVLNEFKDLREVRPAP